MTALARRPGEVRVAVTGDRRWKRDRRDEVMAALEALRGAHPGPLLVVLGDARGVDRMAESCCVELGLPHVVERADWRLGRGAGPVRNAAMLAHLTDPAVDEVWWFHDDLDSSVGTAKCVAQAAARGLRVYDGQRRRRGLEAPVIMTSNDADSSESLGRPERQVAAS